MVNTRKQTGKIEQQLNKLFSTYMEKQEDRFNTILQELITDKKEEEIRRQPEKEELKQFLEEQEELRQKEKKDE